MMFALSCSVLWFFAKRIGPSAPVETGKEYDIEIEDISKQGDGIARIEGFVIFVPETGVGDKAKILVDKVMQRFAIAHKV